MTLTPEVVAGLAAWLRKTAATNRRVVIAPKTALLLAEIAEQSATMVETTTT